MIHFATMMHEIYTCYCLLLYDMCVCIYLAYTPIACLPMALCKYSGAYAISAAIVLVISTRHS
jgi:hypothetical protein